MRRLRVDSLLCAEVWNELRRGNQITEAYVRDKTHLIHGLWEPGRIYINPVPDVVETVIHELIHRLRPRWGEKRVAREADRIIRTLPDADIRRWYRQYQRVAKRLTRPVDSELEGE